MEQHYLRGNPKVRYFGGWQWLARQSVQIQVYGHKFCVKKLNINLAVRTIALFVAIGLYIPLQFLELNPYVFTPIIIAIIGIVLFWFVKRPVPYEFTEIGDSLVFEFANKTMASEFAEVNNVSFY